jgi:hypothetical protein
MLCCIAEIAMFALGIVALVKGSVKILSGREVRGGPARVIGALLLLPLVLGQGGEVVYGVIIAAQAALKGEGQPDFWAM